MNEQEREKASKDQIIYFFKSYSTNWRLAKILINEKILYDKYEYLKDTIDSINNDKEISESIIAQELTYGLGFDMLANCLQYIEDLFALLRAGENRKLFIKNIIDYGSNAITSLINKNHTDKEICKYFHFPYLENDIDIRDGLNQLKIRIEKIKKFYKDYNFFYKQYKHGLTIALKPYGVRYSKEQVQKDKNEKPKIYLVAMDNFSIDIYKKKDYFQNYIFVPCITKNIQPFLDELEKENNLLRYVTTPPELSIDSIKECAKMVKECIHIFINNFSIHIKNDEILELQLPDEECNKVYKFKFPNENA